MKWKQKKYHVERMNITDCNSLKSKPGVVKTTTKAPHKDVCKSNHITKHLEVTVPKKTIFS